METGEKISSHIKTGQGISAGKSTFGGYYLCTNHDLDLFLPLQNRNLDAQS
jgi:hypothetical protein